MHFDWFDTAHHKYAQCKQKGFAPILVLIGIVVIAAVAGAYYFGKSQIQKLQTQDQIISQTPKSTNNVSSLLSTTPTSSLVTQKSYGPDSLWYQSQRKAKEFLNSKIIVTTPAGWLKIDCGDSYNFNPEGGVNSCATEPNAFAINVFPDSPYVYEVAKDNTNAISNLKQNLSFDGKKAVQFNMEVTEGPAQGKYKETVIFYNEDSYLYVILNNLEQEPIYQQFLNNIKFN